MVQRKNKSLKRRKCPPSKYNKSNKSNKKRKCLDSKARVQKKTAKQVRKTARMRKKQRGGNLPVGSNLPAGGNLPAIRHFQSLGLLNRINEFAQSLPLTYYANAAIEGIAEPYLTSD